MNFVTDLCRDTTYRRGKWIADLRGGRRKIGIKDINFSTKSIIYSMKSIIYSMKFIM